MTVSVALDEENGVVLARFHGSSDAQEALSGIAEIRSLVDDRPVDGVLIDVRDADYVPAPGEVRNLVIELVSFLGRRRLALVARCAAPRAGRPRGRSQGSRAFEWARGQPPGSRSGSFPRPARGQRMAR